MNTIFVSSTFQDMQHERDAIQHIVSPRVNAVAKRYGQSVSFCDLRWGINTEGEGQASAARKVIDVCLDEIDRSNPPMVALLGYRYGWTPLVDGLGSDEAAAAERSGPIESASIRKGMMLDDLEISVTELELRFGSLAADGKRMPVLCYFREIDDKGGLPATYRPEDDWHMRKLEELKRRIYAVTGSNVRTYRASMGEGLEDDMRAFAHMLADDLVNALTDEWEAFRRLTPYERTLRSHERIMREKASLIAVNEKLVHDCVDRLTCLPGERIILEGESGVGKTTVASAVAENLVDACKAPVLFLSCGATADTTTANGVMRIEAQFLSRALGRSDEWFRSQGDFAKTSDYRDMIERLCVDLDAAGQEAIVVIDAVDQLVGVDDVEVAGLMPARQHDCLRMLMTTTKHLVAADAVRETIGELGSVSEVLEVLASLERRHAHEVSHDAKQSIASKACSRKPLYISLVYQRLLMMWRPDFERIRNMGDGIDAMARYEAEVVARCPDDMAEMVRELFDEAGDRINPQLTRIVVSGIAASRFGLRAEDFAAISPASWTQVDFSHIVNYLSESFVLREDGRYDFSHRAIRDALCKSPGAWGAQGDILDYLWRLPEDDPIRVSEVAYHCMKADDHLRFSEYIKKCHALGGGTAIEAAAECVYHQVHEDAGAWISDFLHRRGPLFARMARMMLDGDETGGSPKRPDQEIKPDDWRIVSFICFELYPLFGLDKQDGELLERILCDCERFALATADEFAEPDAYYFLTIVGMRIAQLTLAMSGVAYNPTFGGWYRDASDERERLEECGQALRALDRSIGVMTALAKDVDTEQCWYMLAYMHLWRTRALLALGDEREADGSIGTCVGIWERLLEHNASAEYKKGYATALADKARVLLAEGDGRVDEAAGYLIRALNLMGDPDDLMEDDLADYLAFSTSAAITLCNQRDGGEYDAAAEIALTALDLAERLAEKVGGYVARTRLREALYAYGYVLQASGEYPGIRASLPYYERAIDVAIKVHQTTQAEGDRLSCLLIMDQAINILHFLGDEESVAHAGELLDKRNSVDMRPEGQLMMGGEDARQRQRDAETSSAGDAPGADGRSSIVELADEDGRQILLRVIDRFEYRGQDYAVTQEVGCEDEEAIILSVTSGDDFDLYEAVDDEDALEAVFELFKQRNDDFYDFLD